MTLNVLEWNTGITSQGGTASPKGVECYVAGEKGGYKPMLFLIWNLSKEPIFVYIKIIFVKRVACLVSKFRMNMATFGGRLKFRNWVNQLHNYVSSETRKTFASTEYGSTLFATPAHHKDYVLNMVTTIWVHSFIYTVKHTRCGGF